MTPIQTSIITKCTIWQLVSLRQVSKFFWLIFVLDLLDLLFSILFLSFKFYSYRNHLPSCSKSTVSKENLADLYPDLAALSPHDLSFWTPTHGLTFSTQYSQRAWFKLQELWSYQIATRGRNSRQGQLDHPKSCQSSQKIPRPRTLVNAWRICRFSLVNDRFRDSKRCNNSWKALRGTFRAPDVSPLFSDRLKSRKWYGKPVRGRKRIDERPG